MKKLTLFLAMIAMACSLYAAEARRMTIAVNSLSVHDVPFKIENIHVSDSSIATVTTVEDNDRQFRITGKKAGVIEIQVRGGSMSQNFKVTIIANLELLMKDLKFALDSVPEIEIARMNDRLILKGEISNIANMELKNKVVKVYGGSILDLTTFRPTPEVMLALHKNLEKAGYKVVRNGNAKKPGEIAITQVGEMLTITGSVYGPNDLAKIKSIIDAQWWLTTKPVDGKTTGVGGKVAAYINIQIVPQMLQVDVVHISIDKAAAEKIGINWSQFVDGGVRATVDAFWSVINNRSASTSQAGGAGFTAGARNLSAVLAFLGANTGVRSRRAGFLTFKSNDTPQFRKMHSGGTLYLSSGANPGGSSQLKDIDYGLVLEVKGGLTGQNDISLELKQELSFPGPRGPHAQNAELDIKKFATSTSISCKLGETVAIAGLKEFMQDSTDSASIPYLRNVPGLKWMLSEDSDTFTESQILTLVCVRPMAKADGIDPVAVELNKMKMAEDKAMQKREADKHKNDGKWYEFWRW